MKWTKQEIQILKENAGKMTAREIGSLLGKSRWSVLWKAKELGISLQRRISLPKLALSEAEKGYLAGIIDGEGTITISEVRSRKEHEYRPEIIITNTSDKLINHIINLLKKSGLDYFYVPNKQNKKLKRRKPLREVRITSHARVLAFLQMLLPYLILKRRQADIVINFIRSRIKRGISGKGWSPYNDYEINLVREIRELNRR